MFSAEFLSQSHKLYMVISHFIMVTEIWIDAFQAQII